jgi:hypothetical protein
VTDYGCLTAALRGLHAVWTDQLLALLHFGALGGSVLWWVWGRYA